MGKIVVSKHPLSKGAVWVENKDKPASRNFLVQQSGKRWCINQMFWTGGSWDWRFIECLPTKSKAMDTAKFLAERGIRARGRPNPSAAWHGKAAKKLRKAGYPLQAQEHEYSATVSSRLGIPNPNKKLKKTSRARIRQTAAGTFIGGMMIIATILGIAWLAEKAKEEPL